MDEMPEFNTPYPDPPHPPKRKPRKPMKRRAQPLSVTINKGRRRKRRTIKRVKPAEVHANGKFTPEVYRLIGALLNLETPMLNFVMEVTKGLKK
jgi:hypothetical protein